MAKIFISYRRDLDDFLVINLSEKLRANFGTDAVFLDTDNIPLGVDFREHLADAVGQCDVLLAIISKHWLTVTNEQGDRRLDDPRDFVRIEIESALARKIPVIPVLVNETRMPPEADLPESIKKLVYLQATVVRSAGDFDHHIERLVRGLEPHFRSKTAERTEQKNAQPEVEITALQVVKKESGTEQQASTQPATKTKTQDKKPAASDQASAEKKARRAKVLEIIKDGLGDFVDGFLFVGKEIPKNKILGAIASYASDVDPSDVLLLHDDTFFGSGRRGLILTTDAVYYCDWTVYGQFPYKKIQKIRLFKKSGSSKLVIDGTEIKMTSLDQNRKYQLLADIIRSLMKL